MRNVVLEIMHVWWVVLKSGFQMTYGLYRLSRLVQPSIAVFGGKGAFEEGKYALLAQDFAQSCVQKGISVITGGGPGIMEAANCGAHKAARGKKGYTLGISVRDVDPDFKNPCASILITDHFFARVWLLTRYVQGFVLFPGGVGTADELFEVLNLIKLKKIAQVPVILIGSSYWNGLVTWYQHAFEYDFIQTPTGGAFIVTDDINEALRVLLSYRSVS